MKSRKEKTNRPKNTPFHQHQLCGVHLFLDAKNTFPMLLVVGLVLIILGIWLQTEISSIQQMSFLYTDCVSLQQPNTLCSDYISNSSITNNFLSCTCIYNFTVNTNMSGQINFYYTLTNFYQNYRRYVTSRDDNQLHGRNWTISTYCSPFDYNPSGQTYAPCGAIANSLFNDTFQLYYTSNSSTVTVPWTNVNISWQTDREELFGSPNSFINTTKPNNWKYTALQRSPNAYKGDEELIVWMRVSAFPAFRKLHRRLILTDIFSSGLIIGNYSLYINYSFPVQPFNGTKGFTITQVHWLGSNNSSIVVIFLLSGSLHIIACVVLIIWMKAVKRRSAMSL